MRKAGLIILTFIYLALTAGVSVQRHYCMNRMSSVRFTVHTEERCTVCGMEKSERSSDCCRDEVSVFKITDDQQPPFSGELISPDFVYIHSVTPVMDAPEYRTLQSSVSYAHGPPGESPVPIFIRNRVFRI